MRTAIHIKTARKMVTASNPRLRLRLSRSGLSAVLWYVTPYSKRLLSAFPLENDCIERSLLKAVL